MAKGFRLRDALAVAEAQRTAEQRPAAEPRPAAELETAAEHEPAAELETAVLWPAAELDSREPLNQTAAGPRPAVPTQAAERRPAAEPQTAVPRPAAEQRPAAELSSGAPIVEERDGYLRVPNTIVFGVYTQLKPIQRVVFEELYLFTHGFQKNPNVVSQKKIVRRTGISEKYVIRVVKELEEKGFVRKSPPQYGGAQSDRGILVEVWPFTGSDAKATGPRSAAGHRPAAGPRPATGQRPAIKDHEKKHEKAPAAVAPAIDIFGIRTIAARLFEAHRGELGFDRERLRALVEAALVGQGTSPDGELIDEAIRGMVG